MGVGSVDDRHHSGMASEHVASDLMMPTVRPSTSVRPGSSSLLGVTGPWVAERPASSLAVGQMPPASMSDRPPVASPPDHARQPATPDIEPPEEPFIGSRPLDSTARISSDGASHRLTELLAALSVVLDAAERRPEGHAVRTAWVAGRIAAQLSLPDDQRTELLYAGLLGDVGTVGPGADPTPDAARARRTGLSRYRRDSTPAYLSRPLRARAVVATLGLSGHVADTVAAADERWDGRGPAHAHGDHIPRDGRLVALASAVAMLGPAPIPAEIDRMLRTERSRSLDPGLVDEVLRMGRGGLWAELNAPYMLDRMLELEPVDAIRWTHDRHLDAAAVAFADVVDTRTPRMGRHARRVAAFAVRTGAELGLDARLLTDLRRASLLHDIGKLLVPIAFLEKPAELTDAERRVVDEHARAGAAVLGRSRAFARLAPLTVAHHERLDGNGMFPAVADESVALAARVVALSDRYEAMTAERPYRALLSPAQVWSILDEVVGEPMARTALRALRRAVVDTQ
jgi:HD-GYP domain-containing protein (c-di-GMP phosphodiesterase class II)